MSKKLKSETYKGWKISFMKKEDKVFFLAKKKGFKDREGWEKTKENAMEFVEMLIDQTEGDKKDYLKARKKSNVLILDYVLEGKKQTAIFEKMSLEKAKSIVKNTYPKAANFKRRVKEVF